MLNKRRLLNLAAVFFVAAFCYGLGRLLVLRYSTGDVFPAYSSLRADPLGTKVFYESLRALPGKEVSRNEVPIYRLGSGAESTLLLLGARTSFVSDRTRTAFENFVQAGGRLVIALYPRYQSAPRDKFFATPTPSSTPSPTPNPESTPTGRTFADVLKGWGLEMKEDRDAEDDLATTKSSELEENLSWHSGVAFHPQHPEWRIIYEGKRGPVMVERNFSAGSVVLASDSYFVSNEALLSERATVVLAWLVGSNKRIIFDEAHLNVRHDPGVVTLLRRYGLGGFILGFLALLALWLWRNATFSLAPRRTATVDDEIVSGRDSFGGFVHLLRRGIPPSQLVDVCLAEWKKSAGAIGRGKISDDGESREADDRTANPVAAYNRVNAHLNSKKWKTTSAN